MGSGLPRLPRRYFVTLHCPIIQIEKIRLHASVCHEFYRARLQEVARHLRNNTVFPDNQSPAHNPGKGCWRRNLQPANCRLHNRCRKLISASVMLLRNVPRDMPFDNHTICFSFHSYPIPSPTLPLKGREIEIDADAFALKRLKSTSITFQRPTKNHIEPLFFSSKAIFHDLFHFLSCFSRAMALFISSVTSK